MTPSFPRRLDRRTPVRSSPRILALPVVLAFAHGCGSSAGDPAPPGGAGGDGGSGAGAADDAPPLVEQLEIAEVGADRVRLAWHTDEPATSRVDVGVTLDYGLSVTASDQPSLEHSVEVGGLDQEVDFHFRVVCTDAAGNVGLGDDVVFALADTDGPHFIDVEVRQDLADALTVTWRTDEPATSSVVYAATSDLAGAASVQTGGGEALTTEHEVIVAGLTPGTWYLRVGGSDEHGNEGSSSLKVATLGDWVAPDIANLEVEPLFPAAARVSWETSEVSTVWLDHGPDASYGATLHGSAPDVLHSIDIADLQPGAKFHFRVVAVDAAGNERESGDQQFTLEDKVAPVVSDLTTSPAGAGAVAFACETDEPAHTRLEWGVTQEYGNVVEAVDEYVEEHSFLLEGLATGDYHFRVTVTDPSGNAWTGPNSSFVVPDSDPPVITNVAAINLFPGVAIVVWDTDEPAYSLVEYGTTPSLGKYALSAFVPVQDHTVLLLGLSVGSAYHYAVTSADEAGNVTTLPGHQFVAADQTPPLVSNLGAAQTSQTTATVQWKTNEPAAYLVQYGPTAPFGNIVYDDANYATDHVVVLDGLAVGTWHVQVMCADALGNLAIAPTFQLEIADVTPPQIWSVTADAEAEEVMFSWQTDEPATGRVDYGTTPGLGQVAFEPGGLTTDHNVRVTGLTPETTYYFTVTSADAEDNETQSQIATFETAPPPEPVDLAGEMKTWFPLELSATGPVAHELDGNPNPFLDYRFIVRFTSPSNEQFLVPGFFDGDGEGGAAGDVWRARFAPTEPGEWRYELLFHEGDDIAIDLDLGNGAPLGPHGSDGDFQIAPVDGSAEGFYKRGLLEYAGGHYLKFRDGGYFLKGGTNSPENLLGYRGFDNTVDQGGAHTGMEDGLHRFDDHRDDHDSGDPWFVSEDTGYNSKGIIGVLNYLSSVHVNSIYFLPMNLGGDGRETCPFVGFDNSTFDKTHYDISKLEQWNHVFEHAVRKGMLLHFVLNETESGNENWLDGGSLGTQRKLFYRELIARFSHHLAIKWNLSEENDFSQSELESFADYIAALDPYDHPIAFHTHMLSSSGYYGDYNEILGDQRYSATSIQCMPDDVDVIVERWREDSADAGHPWVVDIDEIGPASTGLSATNASDLRKRSLWDVYFSGGHVEWYMGGHDLPVGGDLNVEDLRTREDMWNYMWYARKFLEGLPFWQMEPRDELVAGEGQNDGGAEVFAKEDQVYAVYFPDTSSTGTIDLTETPSAIFRRRWYDPRTGQFTGPVTHVEGNELVPNGNPPSSGSSTDWVLLYERL